MFDIKDLVSFPLRNGHEGVLRGHILTQVGLDSRQYIDGTRRSLDESIDTIRPQRSNEMKPVARFRSREIVAPSLLLLSNPMSFRNLNPRHTLLNSSQVSFYNRLRGGVLRKLGETITSITPTFVKPRETATQKHSHPHSRGNKKNVSPSIIIHPTNPITHRSLQATINPISSPIMIELQNNHFHRLQPLTSGSKTSLNSLSRIITLSYTVTIRQTDGECLVIPDMLMYHPLCSSSVSVKTQVSGSSVGGPGSRQRLLQQHAVIEGLPVPTLS